MGIGPGAFEQLVDLSRRFRPTGRSLMLGRQAFRMGHGAKRSVTDPAVYQRILDTHKAGVEASTLAQDDHFAEAMFEGLGFTGIESLDYSPYQNATHVWDLNQPVPQDWHGQFDFIFDGGTLEHVFNIPQAFANVFNMLSPEGVFVGTNPFNGFPSHGMYQFSPELIWTYWQHACACDVRVCRALGLEGKYVKDLPDPTAIGGRIPLKLGPAWQGKMPSGQVLLWYEVAKSAKSHLPRDVLQSDYVATWTDKREAAQEAAI
jgi:SAM-dependent methyltransferase